MSDPTDHTVRELSAQHPFKILLREYKDSPGFPGFLQIQVHYVPEPSAPLSAESREKRRALAEDVADDLREALTRLDCATNITEPKRSTADTAFFLGFKLKPEYQWLDLDGLVNKLQPKIKGLDETIALHAEPEKEQAPSLKWKNRIKGLGIKGSDGANTADDYLEKRGLKDVPKSFSPN